MFALVQNSTLDTVSTTSKHSKSELQGKILLSISGRIIVSIMKYFNLHNVIHNIENECPSELY